MIDSTGKNRMTFIQHIKNERFHQRRKKPLQRDLFNQICTLVRRFCLDESILNTRHHVDIHLTGKNLESARIRAKELFDLPLFSLTTTEEYHLIKAIIDKFNNPYLQYAYSPEEILLSCKLFRLNPSISLKKLMAFHFATLLQYEHAKRFVIELTEQIADRRPIIDGSCQQERMAPIPSATKALNQQITIMQNFIEQVENIEKNP
jgi:hypothetical protein